MKSKIINAIFYMLSIYFVFYLFGTFLGGCFLLSNFFINTLNINFPPYFFFILNFSSFGAFITMLKIEHDNKEDT